MFFVYPYTKYLEKNENFYLLLLYIMSLIQLSSSQYTPNAQGSTGSQENLGNTGSDFTNRFNSVLTVPPNAKIGLCQALFQMRKEVNKVTANDVQTDDREEPALALFFGGNGSDKFGTYRENMKLFEAQQNFSPTDIPMMIYSPKVKTASLLQYWEEVVKRLQLTATPSLQRNPQVNTTVSPTGEINVNFNIPYNTVVYNTTTSPPNQAQVPYAQDVTFLNNDNFKSLVGNVVPKSVKLTKVTSGSSATDTVTDIKFNASGSPPIDVIELGKRQAMGKTSNNGISDANGYIEMDYFKAGATASQVPVNTPIAGIGRINPNAGRRTYSFGIDRWESEYITAELEKLLPVRFSNPFHKEAFLHAQNHYNNVINGTSLPSELAGYAYGLQLLTEGIIKPYICSDYFFVTLPKMDVNYRSVLNPKFQYRLNEPAKASAPQHIAIFGIERGKRILYTDQEVLGGNAVNPTEWTDGLKEYPTRLVCLACGDRMAQILYNIPYSGFLDSQNVPESADTAQQRNRRFMNLNPRSATNPQPDDEVSTAVQFARQFTLQDDILNPFEKNTVMRGLRIVNKASKIIFERLYFTGNYDVAVKEKKIQIVATRKLPSDPSVAGGLSGAWIKDWIEPTITPDAEIHAVEGFVNISTYPLQTRFGIGGCNGDLISAPALVPVITPPTATPTSSQSNVLDLVSNGSNNAGTLNEEKVQAYVSQDMIIPNCIWNRDFYLNVTPILNYFPVKNNPTSEFISTNRRPSHAGLSEDLSAPNFPLYSVASHTSIVLGAEGLFNTYEALYTPVPIVNPFLKPNITNMVQFTPGTGGEKAIFCDATTNTPNYQDAVGTYVSNDGSNDPIGVGIYCHLEDLPNKSAMGSMNQLQTKLVACINKYDSISLIKTDNDGTQISSLCWNAYEPLYIKLNNPSPIELSQLSVRLTDRFMNSIEELTNTQLVFYLIGDDEVPPRGNVVRMM